MEKSKMSKCPNKKIRDVNQTRLTEVISDDLPAC